MSRRPTRKSRGGPVLPEIAAPEPRVPRRLKVETELVQHLLAALRKLEDPRLAAVVVTRVQMTDDLQLARVFVHFATSVGSKPSRDRRSVMRGLSAASGRLRRAVGQGLALRYTPQLRFVFDDGVDAARRVDELLEQIRHEGTAADDDPSDDPSDDSGE